jgi:phytanoyl-CoA hydroxylase
MAFLSEQQVAQFRRDGYLIVEDLFDPAEDLDPVIEEYKRVLDKLADELYAKGEISSTYTDLPFGQRLIEIYKESGKVNAQYFDFSLPQANVQPDTPYWAGPAVFRMLRNEKLLDAVESIIGPEIYSNPVQHVRLKPPEHLCPVNEKGQVQLGKTPVHQDNGVVTEEADNTEILTVWFPLWDATRENGCLCVWPGSHRLGLIDHCPSDIGLKIPGKFVPGKALSLPMKQGSALFMTPLVSPRDAAPSLVLSRAVANILKPNSTTPPSGINSGPMHATIWLTATWASSTAGTRKTRFARSLY